MLQGCIGANTLDDPGDFLLGFAQQFTLNGSWRDTVNCGAISTQLVRQVARRRF